MMSLFRHFTNLSRRTIENLSLYIIFVSVYSLWIDSVPNKLELFESWTDLYLSDMKASWAYFQGVILSMKPNDSNQSINAPFWLLLLKCSLSLFGKAFFAYRMPGVLLTALAPVLMAEIVRRFFRADLAFLAGLAVGAHQHVITFGRTGGYIGPTLSLLLATVLFGFSVAFEKNRRSWLPLAVMLFLMPFFYSTIRYLCLVGLLGIGWNFIASKHFRRANAVPLSATIALLATLGFTLTLGGRLDHALIFISARGEQFLITDQTVVDGFESEKIKVEHRLSSLLTVMIPQRLSELSTFYLGGRRFFSHRYMVEHSTSGWLAMRPYLYGCFALGLVSCLISAVKRQRYLIVPLWSVMAWAPLLVTTGITPNRMLLGVPADMLLILLGACVPLDLAARYLPARAKWVTMIPLWVAVILFCYHSIFTYFYDYIRYPNL